nr:type 6 secretion system effector deamidase TecA [Burkholderia cenocepacia]
MTQLGGHVAQSGIAERQKHAQALMFGMANIDEYVSRGVCYDAAAYVRYLLRADALIAPDALLDTAGQSWRTRFNLETGDQWDGRASIPAGTAVGFARGGNVFHAAIAVGGTRIRAINGGLLGAGWMNPVDLARALQPDPAGGFTYDRTTIRVHLSRL